MSSFFSIDSPFYKFMNRLLDMLKLNVMWLLCSGVAAKFIIEGIIVLAGFGSYRVFSWIPLLLIGPATTAAFSITLRMVDEEEGYIAKPFLKAYRENFKDGMILGVITLIAVYALYLDFQFYGAAKKIGYSTTGYLIIGIVAGFLAYMHIAYAFALQARYENSIINTMRNSYSIQMKYFPKTIFLFVVLLVEYFVITFSATTKLLGILVGPACVFLTISGFAGQAFRLIENENEERENQTEDTDEETEEVYEDTDESDEEEEIDSDETTEEYLEETDSED